MVTDQCRMLDSKRQKCEGQWHGMEHEENKRDAEESMKTNTVAWQFAGENT